MPVDKNSPAYTHGMAAAEHLHAALFELNAADDGYLEYQLPDRPYGQVHTALHTTLDHLLGTETAKRVEELAGTSGESLAWAIKRDAEDQVDDMVVLIEQGYVASDDLWEHLVQHHQYDRFRRLDWRHAELVEWHASTGCEEWKPVPTNTEEG